MRSIDPDMPILVVDDFSTMRGIIRSLLSELGFESVAEASDGMGALSMLQSGDFQLLITDSHMPGMSGLELLRAVRNHEATRDLPVLLVTVDAKKQQILEAAHAGVNGYIIKPFSAEILSEKIQRIFRRIDEAVA